MSDEYAEFLRSKDFAQVETGIKDGYTLSPKLKPFQADIVRWALRKGKAALFEDCGTGKTIQQLDWARVVAEHTGGRVLILAPLAVAQQTVRQGDEHGIPCSYVRTPGSDADLPKITVTNYEMLDRFDPTAFVGVVLDESSILKSYDGATRTAILDAFGRTPYRLACTATPAPNDFMELGNHSEFLGVMRRTEMLSMFFVHDGGETQKWRLKGHAEKDFWRWMATWAVTLRSPADLGYDASEYILPPLNTETIIVDAGESDAFERGLLFPLPVSTLEERRKARKSSLSARVAKVAEIVNGSTEQFFVLCNLNAEGDALADLIPGSVQVAGADSLADKEERLTGFAEGRHRVLVSKSKIAGFGLNLQRCANIAFAGINDSYESYYQTVRRCYRFGQKRPVTVYRVIGESEQPVIANVERKELEAKRMGDEMAKNMADYVRGEIQGTHRDVAPYEVGKATGEGWTMHLGDCVETLRTFEPNSVDYSVASIPFASLYTYSASDRDLGNSKDHPEFFKHFAFLVDEWLRVTKPGRLISVHVMNLPTSKVRDGYIGITDFRGDTIRAFQAGGAVFHSEVCVWKDPVTAMQRTKAKGLLWMQLKKDSVASRQGIPDYVLTFRKVGENLEPVTHTPEDFPVAVWQRYASPVWFDINASETLQKMSAREEADERHIAPLQLEVIRRCLQLWSNPNDLVLSPFAGIGSEGYEAIKNGRRFVGVELKGSYFKQAVANLQRAERERSTIGLFAEQEISPDPEPVESAAEPSEPETVEA